MHTAIECFDTRMLSKCVVTNKNLLGACKYEAVNAYNRHLILLRQNLGLYDVQHGAIHHLRACKTAHLQKCRLEQHTVEIGANAAQRQ